MTSHQEEDLSGQIVEDRQELLNKFLSQIIPRETGLQTTSTDTKPVSFQTLSAADFPVLPVSTKLEKKILELQRIAASIEQRVPDIRSVTDLDFSKYKVNFMPMPWMACFPPSVLPTSRRWRRREGYSMWPAAGLRKNFISLFPEIFIPMMLSFICLLDF